MFNRIKCVQLEGYQNGLVYLDGSVVSVLPYINAV